MKGIVFLALFIFCLSLQLFGQGDPANLAEYLNEARHATAKNRSLWNVDLYGPVLLVNPQTREVFCNEKDSSGVLVPDGSLFRGKLPNDVNIANTSIKWNGTRWAMILLPLPANRNDRLNLITHELFHRAQPSLNLNTANADNNHLDKKIGRIYLRLELNALGAAVQSASQQEATTHLKNALMFRKLRHHTYHGADSTENLLELNEGLAEYTGLMMSERSRTEVTSHLLKNLAKFQQNKTFVRSFAYQTIPLYGWLTHKFVREFWNKDITRETSLTNYFIAAFNVKLPSDLETYASKAWLNYNGDQIKKEEQQREDDNTVLINEMTLKFVKNPHFEIAFERMNVSFDPRNLIPLENYGTIYPNLRITDNWGVLTVEDGALLSADWSKVSVTSPEEINSRLVKGKGWMLELNSDQYFIKYDESTSNYYLKKK